MLAIDSFWIWQTRSEQMEGQKPKEMSELLVSNMVSLVFGGPPNGGFTFGFALKPPNTE